jgi:transposase
LKRGKEELTTTITFFNRVIESEEITKKWQRSTNILVHKKGNRHDLNNYRTISLLSNLYKLFTKILTNRLAKIMDQNQQPEQVGFRAKYSTVDHLHTINQIIGKTQEYQQKIYISQITGKLSIPWNTPRF